MKLTSHQEQIVEAIISKKVYDISSYLEHFGKSHNQQYNFDHLQTIFEHLENGQTYIFKKGHDSYYYTNTFDRDGNIIRTQRVPNEMTYEFVDYPIDSPVKACLSNQVDVETVVYEGKTYSFNFMKESYPVADSFDEIIDFITLWSYLKREALILEVDKHVTKHDLSIFFEPITKKINANSNPCWSRHHEILSEETESDPPVYETFLCPDKAAKHYIEQEWKLNEENFLTCADYIGKKIIASSELLVYQQHRFKTVEQIAQFKNLLVACVAVGISVISVLIGNIFPLLQPQTTDYLSDISTKISTINTTIEALDSDNSIDKLLQEIQEISASLSEVSRQQLSTEDLSILDDVKTQLEELNAYLSERDLTN